MTISNNYAPIRQLGDGSTVAFSAAWSMISAAYAVVVLEDAITGVQTPVMPGAGPSQYQIAITSSGFTVTFGTAPTSTQYANISRSTPLDQSTPYKTSTGFNGSVQEDSYDKLTAIAQETQQINGRAITAPVGDTALLQMPTAPLRAGKFLAFDSSGNVIVASGASGGTAISTAMTPVVQAATVALALGLLGGTSLVSPAFSGTPTAPTVAGNNNSAQLATTAAVRNSVLGQSFGFTNKFYNPSFDVSQRGLSGSTGTAVFNYTLDGWAVMASTAALAWSKLPGINGSTQAGGGSVLNLQGAGTNSGCIVRQRIEGSIASPLSGKNVTVQFYIQNTSLASVTPKLTVKHATLTDNWAGTVTDVSAVNLQTISSATSGIVSYTFTDTGFAQQGLEISLDFGSALNSGTKNIAIGAADIRSTPNVSVGLNSTPPSPEYRPIAVEMPFCLRYYEKSQAYGTLAGTAYSGGNASGVAGGVSGNNHYTSINYKAVKRATPVLNLYDHTGTSGVCDGYNGSWNGGLSYQTPGTCENGFGFQFIGTGAYVYSAFEWSASAEL